MGNKYCQKENKRLFNIYHGMKGRCFNPNEKRYKDYGGRGILVCNEWLKGFDYFAEWAYKNGYQDDLTIERKDNDGNYCPENCCWISRLRQSYNKRTSVFVTYKGKTKCLMDWCNELNLPYDSIHNRITKGWSIDKAFEIPLFDQNKSFSRLCREHNINANTARSRMDKFGWSLERALSVPSNGRGTKGKDYKTA